MPKLYRVGKYAIFFWSNENNEPVHVHIGIVEPEPNATKIWLTKSGGCIVAHNKSRIPDKDLNHLLQVIKDNYLSICAEWQEYFGTEEVDFYC